MCVKCGISNCGGCSGKDLLSGVTGDIVYDGDAITCVSDGSIDITSGEKLNSVIAKIMAALCPDSITNYFYTSGSTGGDLVLSSTGSIKTSDPVASDGSYLVRSVIHLNGGGANGTLFSQVDFNLKRNGTNSLNPNDSNLGRSVNWSDTVFKDCIVMEVVTILTAGDVIDVQCASFSNTTSTDITYGQSLYIQKLG